MQLFDFVSYSSQDPPKIQIATASSLTSWVYQTATLNVSKMVFLNQGRKEVYFFVADPVFLRKFLIPDPKSDENFDP